MTCTCRMISLSLVVCLCGLAQTEIPIANPGFEDGWTGWAVGDKGMTALSQETPYAGTTCIRVSDSDTNRGSSLAGAGFAASPGILYRVRFQGRPIEGSGVAVYLQFFSAEEKLLTSPDRRNEINFTIPGGKKEWRSFTLYGESPADTAKGRIWVHSYNGVRASADLDDFELAIPDKEEVEKAKMAEKQETADRAEFATPDPERIAAIAALLESEPKGLGDPIDERRTWDILARREDARNVIKAAEKYLETPPPEVPDDLYLDFSRTGNRDHYQRPYGERSGRIGVLAKAECLENRGRFLAALERDILAMCEERSWTMPAHDGSLTNFKGTHLTIDLGSSARAWLLATCDYWLGARLSPPVRARIREEVGRRIFTPYLTAVRAGQTRGNWWIRGTNNWNAVCTASVVGTALALVGPAAERAEFLAAMEISNPYFLQGFTDDGYCSEGVGYWNYGFGHYMMLGYMVDRATAGRLSIFEDPKLTRIAAFARDIQIEPGVSPAFADCSISARAAADVLVLIKRYFPDVVSWDVTLNPLGGSLTAVGIFAFGGFPLPENSTEPILPLRSWFADAGILVSRSSGDAEAVFGAAIKGGHNNEHHNHNDVGSFIVVSDGRRFLLDPGGEVYTRRTFSRERYVSNVLNSYGHPVPLVAGQLQRTGNAARGVVLETDFTDERDRLVIDLTSAYDVPALKRLVRTFTYDRPARRITIEDSAAFDSPQAFGSALITFDRVFRGQPDRIYVYDDAKSVRIDLAATGGRLEIAEEEIDNPGRPSPTRIGLNFAEPVTTAALTCTICPDGLVKGMPGLYWAPEPGPAFQPDLPRAIVLEAENFSSQAGGEVTICDKVGASGRTFRFWDKQGHELGWTFDVAAAGRYAIQVRYAQGNRDASHREVWMDGQILAAGGNSDALFPDTGGWSSSEDNWQDLWLAVEGEPLVAELAPGKHVLCMKNTVDGGVNLDLIRIVPLKP